MPVRCMTQIADYLLVLLFVRSTHSYCDAVDSMTGRLLWPIHVLAFGTFCRNKHLVYYLRESAENDGYDNDRPQLRTLCTV